MTILLFYCYSDIYYTVYYIISMIVTILLFYYYSIPIVHYIIMTISLLQ